MPGLDIASRVYPTCVIITCAQFGLARIAVASIFLRRELDRRIKSGDDDGASQRSAGPCFCQATGAPVSFLLSHTEGAERRQAHHPFHACEARRASCAVDKFTQSAHTSTRHARLSALHQDRKSTRLN